MSTNQKLSAINNMQESRVGGWLNNNKLNIGVKILSLLIKNSLNQEGCTQDWQSMVEKAKAVL